MSDTRIDRPEQISVWDGADLDVAAQSAIEVYGPDAMTAAAHCGLEAHFDGREQDFRFWVEVFRLLQARPGLSPVGLN